MPASVLDRPIRAPKDDRLERGDFVEGLVRALLSDDRRRARGVVIGLEGEWGSGKSSILNLVAERLVGDARENHLPEPVIVRFDPWLISGRDDLIAGFLRALVDEIDPIGRERARLGSGVGKLARYGEMLAPALKFLGAPLGEAVGGAFKAIAHAASPGSNPFDLRESVEEALDSFGRPIVVLVDELDRVEDAEVRTLAQLVRSVMDFPSLSYLLAYDPQRVAEALGGGPRDDQRRRGEAYLEKIVQLRVPVPALTPDKLIALLEQVIHELITGQPVAQHLEWKRLRSVVYLAAGPSADGGPLVRTLRDVKRTLGIFAALEPMLRYEIDPVDLVGWSILLAKRPGDVARLKSELGRVCAGVHDADGGAMVRLAAEPGRLLVRVPGEDDEMGKQLFEAVHPFCRYLVWNATAPGPPGQYPPRPPDGLCWQDRLLVAATVATRPPLFPVDPVQSALSSLSNLTAVFEEACGQGSRLGFFLALKIARHRV